MRNLFFFAFFSLFFSFYAKGQIERSIFEAYDLKAIEQIQINITDSVHVEFWPGDNILVESNIAFYNGTKDIFERLIKEGRYNLSENRSAKTLNLSIDVKNTQIAGSNGEICYETIERTIYIPENYAQSGNMYIIVKEE